MTPKKAMGPGGAATLHGARIEQLGGQLKQPNNPRSVRRQHLVKHLCRCGERCVLEALVAIEAGQDLDFVLSDFARLQPEIYQSIGADELPVDGLTVIKGGKR